MAKTLAVVFGIVFLIVGALGFFGNPIVGKDAYFVTDAVHNAVHLLIGIVLLIAAGKSESAAALSLKVFGVVYLILFIDGLIEKDMLLGFVAQNSHDTWLHLLLGIVLLIAGFTAKGNTAMTMDRTTM
jgi:hypothetical protein